MTGSVISGTHRNEDLIPAFIDALSERLDTLSLSCPEGWELEYSQEYGRVQEHLGEIERRMEQEGYFEGDDAAWDLEWLFNELNALAPEGTYFGAHPGDGSDFGFWPEEFLRSL